jgi:hypothetical protein
MRGTHMNEHAAELDHDEVILSYEVSDEALETMDGIGGPGDVTALDRGEDDSIGFEVSDEVLEAASRTHLAAGPSFSPGSLTMNFICCSVA